jgi:hypothetical protein
MSKGNARMRCEKCESDAKAAKMLKASLTGQVVVETIEVGDFEPEALPKTG